METGASGVRTALVAEDYQEISQLIADILAGEGYRVVTVTRGSEVVNAARACHPRVVLLDLALPDIPGSEVLRQLAREPLTAVIPVIIVSAYSERLPPSPQVRAIISKPFDIDKLVAAVREVDRSVDCS